MARPPEFHEGREHGTPSGSLSGSGGRPTPLAPDGVHYVSGRTSTPGTPADIPRVSQTTPDQPPTRPGRGSLPGLTAGQSELSGTQHRVDDAAPRMAVGGDETQRPGSGTDGAAEQHPADVAGKVTKGQTHHAAEADGVPGEGRRPAEHTLPQDRTSGTIDISGAISNERMHAASDSDVPPNVAGTPQPQDESAVTRDAEHTFATKEPAEKPPQRGIADEFGIISFHDAHDPVPRDEEDAVQSAFGPRVNDLFATHKDYINRDAAPNGRVYESLWLTHTTPESGKLNFSMKRASDATTPDAFRMEVLQQDGQTVLRHTLHQYYPDSQGTIRREDVNLAQLLAGGEHVPLVLGNATEQAAAVTHISELAQQARAGRDDEQLLGINKQPIDLAEFASVLGFAEQARIQSVSLDDLRMRIAQRLREPAPSAEETQGAAAEFGTIVDNYLNRHGVTGDDESGNRGMRINVDSGDGAQLTIEASQIVEPSGNIVPRVKMQEVRPRVQTESGDLRDETIKQHYWIDPQTGSFVGTLSTEVAVYSPNNSSLRNDREVGAYIGKADARHVRNFLPEAERD